MEFVIERASIEDVDELLKLYFLIYQNNYPLAICSDREVMAKSLKSDDICWYVTRLTATRQIVGSAVFEMDAVNRIGKLTGVVVRNEYRKRDLASGMISRGTGELLGPKGPLRSIYTTTRTNSRGPQIMVLKNGFIPLGIFPNAHKLKEFETLTLMAKFSDGVLKSRGAVAPVPEKLAPIVNILQKQIGLKTTVEIANAPLSTTIVPQEELDFELIMAPKFVLRRFNELASDPYDRFFPFHTPNLLMASTNGEVEIFAYINKSDGYLAIVSLNQPLYKLGGRIRPLLHQLRGIGVSYIEILIGLQHTKSLQGLIDAQFLPSAIYPAMLEMDGKLNDFALMTRTLEPLNFRGMSIESGFKPYVDQYVELWKNMHLETLEVFDEYK